MNDEVSVMVKQFKGVKTKEVEKKILSDMLFEIGNPTKSQNTVYFTKEYAKRKAEVLRKKNQPFKFSHNSGKWYQKDDVTGEVSIKPPIQKLTIPTN